MDTMTRKGIKTISQDEAASQSIDLSKLKITLSLHFPVGKCRATWIYGLWGFIFTWFIYNRLGP